MIPSRPCPRSLRRRLAASSLLACAFALLATPALADDSACSVGGDGAPGAEQHLKEIAADGALYADWMAPEFELPATHGQVVSLHALRGTPVALVFLTADCAESVSTLSIVETLRNRFAGASLEIVPVVIASGDAATVAVRADEEWNVRFPLVVSKDVAISQAYDGFVVPSAYMIDAAGKVRRRLTGFKGEAALDAAIAELLADSYPPAPVD